MRNKILKTFSCISLFMITGLINAQDYPIVSTNQTIAYNNNVPISLPLTGDDFYGQDANFTGLGPDYTDNGDGTITDEVTGLMWQKTADLNGDGEINAEDKLTFSDALNNASLQNTGGYNDWRLPTIKELYSLILFSGMDISGENPTTFIPFIDTNYFDFGYGDETAGERLIDAQYVSSTEYVSTTMLNSPTVFGVNFADGRIKGYGYVFPTGGELMFYVKYVRGNSNYGVNNYSDLGNGIIHDQATGLYWAQNDYANALSWQDALAYADTSTYGGYDDWRLPSAKELESIVDYTRSPATTNSAAIDPIFNCTSITDEGGNVNYPWYWTATTHAMIGPSAGVAAAYVCFGSALGYLETPPESGIYTLTDVHGAGAQRSDFKTGDPADYPNGHGPQGDVVRIYNYVRLVRGNSQIGISDLGAANTTKIYPQPANNKFILQLEDDELNRIAVYDLMGKLVYQQETQDSSIEIECSNWPSSIYFLKIEKSDHTFLTKTITVSH